MTKETQSHKSDSGEIDLGALLRMFRKGLNLIFKGILRIFLYLKKNAIKLGALILIGMVLGLSLNLIVDKKLKTEVIVKPNFESKDYLYDVVEEIQANILSKDTLFFRKLDIDVKDMRGFEISIEPIENLELDNEKIKEDNNYLEILQYYKDNDFVLKVIKSEILKKSGLTHRITFLHKNQIKGEDFVRKLMGYINANPYFNELQQVYHENSQFKIDRNQELIKQIDELVANYTAQLSQNNSTSASTGMVLLDNEKGLDVPNLLGLKNLLLRQIEQTNINIVEEKSAIGIINFGKTQVIKQQFLNKSFMNVPLILVLLFFAWSLMGYLNKKSKELT
tara:strand:- start:15668 stop:16675 length:1008 start_codon:yes stop_codon:yes gene_type:complete